MTRASSSQLKTAIEEAGRNAGVDMFFISVVVANGAASIWGMAETAAAKNALRVAAEGV